MKRITIKDLTGLDLTFAEMLFIVEYQKDNDARRAAKVAGYAPDEGLSIREKPEVRKALLYLLESRLDKVEIDAEWVLREAVDNHHISRQKGNMSASNKALDLIARHAAVDAMSAEKVTVNTSEEIRARLQRGRERAAGINNEPSFL